MIESMYRYLVNSKRTPKGKWRVERSIKLFGVFNTLAQAEKFLVNPQTIDEIKVEMAKRLGYGGMCISNAFEVTIFDNVGMLLIVFENGEKYLEWEISIGGY